jgi:hypothetical protein
MNCNFKQSKGFMFCGVPIYASLTPCKSCRNNNVCGFNKVQIDCRKYLPK